MRLSNTHFDTSLPYWQDYLPFLQLLAGREFPCCDQLNTLLPDGLRSEGGPAIRFVPSTQLNDDSYEHRIFTTGQVSTRPGNWHDVFNALVWMRFPCIKVAMNALHYHAGPCPDKDGRGPLRDALTLFDECGVIVFSSRLQILESLARRCWTDVFQSAAFKSDVYLSISGHAMLEKYLSPYKSMTAKALLVHVDTSFLKLSRQEMLTGLDVNIAKHMLSGQLLTQPASLSPLPLAGVPAWWPESAQNEDGFYADPQVFRAADPQLIPAPVYSL